jgi:L,D-transpeptidase ErfK/SrfK
MPTLPRTSLTPCSLLPTPPLSLWRLPALLGMVALLQGCASWLPLDFGPPSLASESERAERAARLETHRFPLGGNDTVVGRLATVPVREGDSLPDIARHFGLGHEQMGAANPDLDMWAPEPGRRAVLPLEFTLPEAPRKGIVVNLAAMRLFFFPGKGGKVITYPVGIGREGRSTPTGAMAIERKAAKPVWYVPESIRRDHARKGDPLPAAVLPGPDNPLGAYAMYLSRPSYLIHGTNKPYAIGLRASNGCLRLYPEDIEPLYQAAPLKTPVRIVNQPYLLGWRNGEPHLEAHPPHEELNGKALKAALHAKLKAIEKQGGPRLDWPKIEATLAEARGIPVPILEQRDGMRARIDQAIALDVPDRLYGRPEVPALAADGWYLKVLETGNELTARRTAAVLNHFGPQIPARTLPADDGGYRVIAGPFRDAKAAKAAMKTLRMDLEIQSELMAPNQGAALRNFAVR